MERSSCPKVGSMPRLMRHMGLNPCWPSSRDAESFEKQSAFCKLDRPRSGPTNAESPWRHANFVGGVVHLCKHGYPA
eukprot:1143893-Pelagomonas_calceolata.AAC.16